jgi:hypothetical protein
MKEATPDQIAQLNTAGLLPGFANHWHLGEQCTNGHHDATCGHQPGSELYCRRVTIPLLGVSAFACGHLVNHDAS